MQSHPDRINHPVVLRLTTDNDRNGNPRRLVVVTRAGAVLDTEPEGYAGPVIARQTLAERLGIDADELRDAMSPTIPVTPSTYREFVAEGAAARKARR